MISVLRRHSRGDRDTKRRRRVRTSRVKGPEPGGLTATSCWEAGRADFSRSLGGECAPTDASILWFRPPEPRSVTKHPHFVAIGYRHRGTRMQQVFLWLFGTGTKLESKKMSLKMSIPGMSIIICWPKSSTVPSWSDSHSTSRWFRAPLVRTADCYKARRTWERVFPSWHHPVLPFSDSSWGRPMTQLTSTADSVRASCHRVEGSVAHDAHTSDTSHKYWAPGLRAVCGGFPIPSLWFHGLLERLTECRCCTFQFTLADLPWRA